MKLLLVDNVHIIRTKDGSYYTLSVYNEAFFERYLNVFDSVRLVAKTRIVDRLDDINNYIHINYENVEIYEISWYRGLKEFAKKIIGLSKEFSHATDGCDCIIYRVTQIESFMVYLLGKRKLHFALEVVNNPIARKGFFIRNLSVFLLKRMCKRADGVAYVTKFFLQGLYPANKMKGAFTASYSSVEIEKSQIVEYKEKLLVGRISLIHVANVIEGNEKGHDTVLKTLKCLTDKGYDTQIIFLGDGSRVDFFKRMAKDLSIEDRVEFKGRIVDKAKYLSVLQKTDIMIFPSLSEGLPRVIIEAMAAGLACVASPVGGTPELLDQCCLINHDDVEGYSDAISRLINDNELYNRIRKNNIAKAYEYERERLTKKRTAFYYNLEARAREPF